MDEDEKEIFDFIRKNLKLDIEDVRTDQYYTGFASKDKEFNFGADNIYFKLNGNWYYLWSSEWAGLKLINEKDLPTQEEKEEYYKEREEQSKK